MKIVHPIKMNLIFISRYIYISPSYHPMVSPLYRNYITSVQTCYFYPSYITRDGLVLCTAVWLVQSSAGLNHCITTSQKMGGPKSWSYPKKSSMFNHFNRIFLYKPAIFLWIPGFFPWEKPPAPSKNLGPKAPPVAPPKPLGPNPP